MKGVMAQLDTKTFGVPDYLMGGYMSWGNDDSRCTVKAWNSLKFAPGSMVNLFNSSDGRNICYAQPGDSYGGFGWNQTQGAALIHNGATCLQLNIGEPYGTGEANPIYCFPSYINGFNMAESFAYSTQYVSYKEVMVGDPLTQP